MYVLWTFFKVNVQLQPPATLKEKDLDGNRYSALLQTLLWLGFEEDREKWSSHAHSPGGELTTYAETVIDRQIDR